MIGGASERFRVAGFEGHDGRGCGGGTRAVFLGDIFVLLLEVEHGGCVEVWDTLNCNKLFQFFRG